MSDNQITKLSGLDITPDADNKKYTGLYVPQLTTDERDAIPNDTLRNGALIYNSDVGGFQVYQRGNWRNLNSSNTQATGVGLVNSTPFVLPSGPQEEVEVADNEVTGFIYHNTTNNNIRMYTANSWLILV